MFQVLISGKLSFQISSSDFDDNRVDEQFKKQSSFSGNIFSIQELLSINLKNFYYEKT